jgi:hypothetical protein
MSESCYGLPSLDVTSFYLKEHSFYSIEDLNGDLEAAYPPITLMILKLESVNSVTIKKNPILNSAITSDYPYH